MGAFMVFSPNSETNKHLTHQPGMGLGKMYIGSGHPKQLLKRLIRLTLLALPNLSGQQAKTLFDNGREQGLLIGKMAIRRAMAHAGPASYLAQIQSQRTSFLQQL